MSRTVTIEEVRTTTVQEQWEPDDAHCVACGAQCVWHQPLQGRYLCTACNTQFAYHVVTDPNQTARNADRVAALKQAPEPPRGKLSTVRR